MKKMLVLIISLLLILSAVGIVYKYNKNNIEEKTKLENELKGKLEEYTDSIITQEWLDTLEPGLYVMQLISIKEIYNYDTTMFKNTDGEDCDYGMTKAQIIIKENTETGERTYEKSYIIVCD